MQCPQCSSIFKMLSKERNEGEKRGREERGRREGEKRGRDERGKEERDRREGGVELNGLDRMW